MEAIIIIFLIFRNRVHLHIESFVKICNIIFWKDGMCEKLMRVKINMWQLFPVASEIQDYLYILSWSIKPSLNQQIDWEFCRDRY